MTEFFFSRTMWPISNKLGTKHPWEKGLQFCSNEGPRPFTREDNHEITKIHGRNLKFKNMLLQPNFNQPWQKSSLGDQDLALFQVPRWDDYEIAKIHWRNLNLLQSNMAHGPLVSIFLSLFFCLIGHVVIQLFHFVINTCSYTAVCHKINSRLPHVLHGLFNIYILSIFLLFWKNLKD